MKRLQKFKNRIIRTYRINVIEAIIFIENNTLMSVSSYNDVDMKFSSHMLHRFFASQWYQLMAMYDSNTELSNLNNRCFREYIVVFIMITSDTMNYWC